MTTMTLAEAFSRINAPKGYTTAVSALLSGDLSPMESQSAVGASLAQAKETLASVQKSQTDCRSDWAWWGYQGDISYWLAAVDILRAADLVGADKLPDVPAPGNSGVVMDLCARVENFGRGVLAAAKAQSTTPSASTP